MIGGGRHRCRCRHSWRRRSQHHERAEDAAATRPLRHVAFWSDQICERGTEVALYDYADYAEQYLGIRAHVLYDAASPKNDAGTVAKFAARFGSYFVGLADGWDEVDRYLASSSSSHAINLLYCIKVENDGRVIQEILA